MRRLQPIIAAIACWSITLVAAVPSPVAADTVADFGTDYGDLEPELRESIDDEILDIFEESVTWQWLPADEGYHHLDDDLQGCFDEICLLEIAGHLDATVGMTIELDVTSSIYRWEVELYDLLEGESVAVDEGVCELCGRTEVIESFRASVHGQLATLDVDDETDAPAPEELTEVRFENLPEDTKVRIDGRLAGTGETTAELPEGTHQIEFVGDDHDDITDELVIDDRTPSPKVVRVHIGDSSRELNTVVARGDAIVDSLGKARAPVGWSALILGTGMTVGSFMLAGMHGQPTCGDDVHIRHCETVYNTAGVATTTTIAGVLSIVTGATLVAWPSLTERPGPTEQLDENGDAESSLQLAPSVGRDFSGVSIGGSF